MKFEDILLAVIAVISVLMAIHVMDIFTIAVLGWLQVLLPNLPWLAIRLVTAVGKGIYSVIILLFGALLWLLLLPFRLTLTGLTLLSIGMLCVGLLLYHKNKFLFNETAHFFWKPVTLVNQNLTKMKFEDILLAVIAVISVFMGIHVIDIFTVAVLEWLKVVTWPWLAVRLVIAVVNGIYSVIILLLLLPFRLTLAELPSIYSVIITTVILVMSTIFIHVGLLPQYCKSKLHFSWKPRVTRDFTKIKFNDVVLTVIAVILVFIGIHLIDISMVAVLEWLQVSLLPNLNVRLVIAITNGIYSVVILVLGAALWLLLLPVRLGIYWVIIIAVAGFMLSTISHVGLSLYHKHKLKYLNKILHFPWKPITENFPKMTFDNVLLTVIAAISVLMGIHMMDIVTVAILEWLQVLLPHLPWLAIRLVISVVKGIYSVIIWLLLLPFGFTLADLPSIHSAIITVVSLAALSIVLCVGFLMYHKTSILLPNYCDRQQRNHKKSERTADNHHVTQVIPLPAHWDPQPKDSRNNEEEVHLVTLDPVKDADEFHKVMMEALLTADMTISQIQRVQNPLLYGCYALKKLKMDEGKDSNERKLFHGTDRATCDLINHKGFNRSFCGKNGTVYGKGVYFARDARYSANKNYSPADTRGRRYMYLASVLVGEYTANGYYGLRTPPPKNPGIPTVMYDTVVDNSSNPQIYVVFYDNQCYPDYLITFS